MAPSAVPFRLTVLGLAAAFIVVAAAFWGPTPIPLRTVLDAHSDPTAAQIFWQLRVPRALLAAVAGAGLALGGVVCQALFRNPLAEPYTLGIASGASLFASLGFFAGWTGLLWLGIPALSWLAFAGALAAGAIVFALSTLTGLRDPTRLLLAGVCVAYLCAAGVVLVTYFADRAVTNDIVRWMMGSLVTVRPRAALEVALALIPIAALLLVLHRQLDLLQLGEDLAATRGVAVERVVWGGFGLVGVLTAAIVAHCGPIGFVGLMVPHMARAIVGPRALSLLIAAPLLGAAFLSLCDAVARSVAPVELPVGAVTSVLGAGFFFYLLATRRTGG